MKLILQTRRLTLRELEKEDVGALRLILQDPLVMYAWEHAFTDAEIRGWIETNQARYQKDGCGYWAAHAPTIPAEKIAKAKLSLTIKLLHQKAEHANQLAGL